MTTKEDVLIVAMATAFALAVAWLIRLLRERHASRMADLRLADQHLTAHFDALERVLATEKVSRRSKDYLRAVSSGLGNKAIAEDVAFSILKEARTGITEPLSAWTNEFFAEIERLNDREPAIVEDIASVLHFGMSAMLLRFPLCNAAYRTLDTPEAVRRSRRPVSEIKKASATIAHAIPADLVPA